MDAMKRMGISYGKLGLAPSAALIEARGVGVKAAAKGLKLDAIPEIVRCIFGLKTASGLSDFVNYFNAADPTCDLQACDQETALLAATVAAYEIEKEGKLAGILALIIVATSLGGVRRPIADENLLSLADRALAMSQGKATAAPLDRTYTKASKATMETATALAQHSGNANYAAAAPHIIASFSAANEYAEAGALAAARSDNEILAYIRRLEEEVRIYWWVAGGWSGEANKAFHTFPAAEAAIRAAKELAERHSTFLGLFSAPALLDLVLERGRSDSRGKISIADAAVAPDRLWRVENFAGSANRQMDDLFPIVAAMGIAAESDDAADWQPRFSRLTNVDPTLQMIPVELGIQVYREQLALRAFSD